MKKILLSVLLLACAGAQAQKATEKAYIGLGLGPTSFRLDCASYNPCDRNDSGVKVYAGLHLMPDVAVEASYMDFGKGRAGRGVGGVEFGGSALVLNGAFRYAFIPEFSGVLRLGVSNSKAEVVVRATGSDNSERSFKPYFGFGLEYTVSKNIKAAFAADFLRGDINDSTIKAEMYSLSAQMGF